MPGPDEAADLWPNTFSFSASERARMDAHADALLQIAAAAVQRIEPGRPLDAPHTAYLAVSVVLRRAELSRAQLSAALPPLLTDTSLAVGALRQEKGGSQLVVTAEHCRQVLWLIWRNARDRLERQLGGGTPTAPNSPATGAQ